MLVPGRGVYCIPGREKSKNREQHRRENSIFADWVIFKGNALENNKTPKDKQLATDMRYLQMARIWATNSYCRRRQVGALLVKDKMIISDGYNGTPAGFENYCEDENNDTKPYVLHAEANAITKVAKSNNSSEGSTLYITTSPCMECSKLIIQAGISRVVFIEKYRNHEGLDLLKRANIEIVHIPEIIHEVIQER